ncbi:MAG: sigma-70 family RNA polymerase sigma factor [Cetobacterium sp.]|uniref:sigma-70 family RNA polymerase sigma factor n=1 Tax=unclassified Cetobacterium TaxID=2630983 RepID=UPI00163C90B4|nr:sigma-70 family RNA polymerase sigma factor [Cetobacterium sp. 2A]MBC2856376.1 sigma-70 family RNA polymerase sigma factor [Cetobacterium sp. 2A]
MKTLNIKDYEVKIIKELRDEEDFLNFLEIEGGIKIDFSREEEVLVETKKNEYFSEEIVPEYLEEISHYLPITKEEEAELLGSLEEEESRERLIVGYLREAAKLSLDYLKSGIDYMDLIQEGSVSIIKSIDEYRVIYGDFSDYMRASIIRALVLFLEMRLEDVKSSYVSYFSRKKEELIEHEIVSEIEADEDMENEEDEEDEFKILGSSEEIKDKIEKIAKVNIWMIPNKINQQEKEIIDYYYGLIGDKRESLFEIENKMNLTRGEGEIIFTKALERISTGGGRLFKI